MTTFYICRHGETENNKNHRLMGWIDTPLTEEGVQNAASSAAKLHGVEFDKIVSSDLGRAFTTAYLITRELNLKLEIERLSNLREVNYGDLANQPYEAFPDLPLDKIADYVPRSGESLARMKQRVLSCLQAVAADSPSQTILVVAHDGTISAVRTDFTKQSIAVGDTVHNPHDFVAKFEWDEDQIISFTEIGAEGI